MRATILILSVWMFLYGMSGIKDRASDLSKVTTQRTK